MAKCKDAQLRCDYYAYYRFGVGLFARCVKLLGFHSGSVSTPVDFVLLEGLESHCLLGSDFYLF